ncbi:hypothetical protein SELR_pSRC101260 (plasmid) [Selenomonas ruminantium subsp. lactilytica TAM6421]|uniref:Uncharacterized protein n=1 Tax=Selenomonas ruminantium subsp. lactilytica (strain NBRC 103574 / TAM6421) TaxID=927704 RepID=I0GVZ6_SELRL|nr:hypothetical protein [Selenomonas ruminantium]BAL84933.1 hypothetical protein SELR_pSRC101260 [Selenomonas ruminantium subsp. lactilytica TAM6421]
MQKIKNRGLYHAIKKIILLSAKTKENPDDDRIIPLPDHSMLPSKQRKQPWLIAQPQR